MGGMLDMEGVTGSNPVPPTIFLLFRDAQSAGIKLMASKPPVDAAPASGGPLEIRGRRDSRHRRHNEAR